MESKKGISCDYEMLNTNLNKKKSTLYFTCSLQKHTTNFFWDYQMLNTNYFDTETISLVSATRPINSKFMTALTPMTFGAPIMKKGKLSLHI